MITSSDRAERITELAPSARILTLNTDDTVTLINTADAIRPLPIVDRYDYDLATLVYTSSINGRIEVLRALPRNIKGNVLKNELRDHFRGLFASDPPGPASASALDFHDH